MNTWMNNKFNKQEFPTGNVKQIILQSALNFNQSLSITFVLLRSSASAESALGNDTNSLGRRHRVQECRRQSTIRRSCPSHPRRASLSKPLLVASVPVEIEGIGESYSYSLASITLLLLPIRWNQKLWWMAEGKEEKVSTSGEWTRQRNTRKQGLQSCNTFKTWMICEIGLLSVKTPCKIS